MNAAIIKLIQPGNFVPKKKPIRVWSPINKAHSLGKNAYVYYLVNRINDEWFASVEVHSSRTVLSKVFGHQQGVPDYYFQMTKWVEYYVTIRAIEIINGSPQRVLVEFVHASEFQNIKSETV